jgi:3-oxoacyl-[acyl-carrier protein] reductase
MDLTDKVALITGASSGIGAATAAVFADLGAKVAIGYHHNQRGAEQVRDSIANAGGHAIAIQADVRQQAGIAALVRGATERFGPIDILVNNAGSLVERMKVLEITEEK